MSAESDKILAQLQSVGAEFREKQPGAREQLIKLSRALISSLELPSEAIQRIGWAEVIPSHAIALQIKQLHFLDYAVLMDRCL
jgi:hypothetical protein